MVILSKFMSCYSRTDCRLFERQGKAGKKRRKQDRKERQSIKSVLSSTLLPWVTGVQCRQEILADAARFIAPER